MIIHVLVVKVERFKNKLRLANLMQLPKKIRDIAVLVALLFNTNCAITMIEETPSALWGGGKSAYGCVRNFGDSLSLDMFRNETPRGIVNSVPVIGYVPQMVEMGILGQDGVDGTYNLKVYNPR